MAFCIACFIRDIAGATKFHQAAVVQYFRPEIVGLVVGSFLIAIATKEFKVTSGSSPLTRFVLGVCTMILALIFLGCPLRMLLRMTGGDLNAYVAFVGFLLGVVCGAFFLKKGYELTDDKKENNNIAGFILPIALVVLLVAYNMSLGKGVDAEGKDIVTAGQFAISNSGPGAAHAAVFASLIGAIVFGIIAQKSRTCFAGSIRNAIFTKDVKMFLPILGLFVTMLVFNITQGKFKPSFDGQPVAHSEHFWNFISMFGVGLCATFAGGCPLRQLILSGEGHIDNVMNVIGMFVGAAIAHNFGLASSANGTTPAGRVAAIVCLIIVVCIGLLNTKKTN